MYSMLLCGQYMHGKFLNSYIVELGSKILCILCYYVVNICMEKFLNSYIVELGSKILCILCYYVVNLCMGNSRILTFSLFGIYCKLICLLLANDPKIQQSSHS